MTRTFRLARVLKLRNQQRVDAERAVQGAVEALAETQRAHADTIAAATNTWQTAQQSMLQGVSGAQLGEWAEWMQALAQRETELAVLREQRAAEVMERRAALVSARREERKLERLHEIWRARRDVAEARIAGALLDEHALRTHAAEGRGEGR